MYAIKKSIRKLLNVFGYEIVKLSDHISYAKKDSWLQKLHINTIIDIGANEGQFVNNISRILPGRKIYSFEPIKHCYNQLLKKTSQHNVTAYNYAVGDVNTDAEINISGNYVSSSLLKMEDLHIAMYPKSEYVKKEQIRVVRLDDILKDEGLKDNILIKIDVQGFEEQVLKGGRNTIDKAHAVIIEIALKPLYENQWRFDDVYQYFIGKGFIFLGFTDQVCMKVTGIPLYADGIFLKKEIVDKVY